MVECCTYSALLTDDDNNLEDAKLEEADPGSFDMVQFDTDIYIVDADSGEANLRIMRIGRKTGTVSITYETREGSAKAGKQFILVPQTRLTMAPGQGEAFIPVKLVNDRNWNATKEFSVKLANPRDCKLGFYLNEARVKVTDPDIFPDNVFKENVTRGEEGIGEINSVFLFASFMRMMSAQDGVWWRTVLTCVLDQSKNVYKYLTLVLSVYMVDKVFDAEESAEGLIVPDNRLGTAYVVASLILCPALMLHVVDLIIISMDIKGMLRLELSQSLFRKFMNYNKESEEEVPLAVMVSAVTDNISLVTGGYSLVLRIIALIGKVCISISFTLQTNPHAWWATVVAPAAVIVWVTCRIGIFIAATEKADAAQSHLATLVNEAISKLQLISAYQQRPSINEVFADKASKLKEAKVPQYKVILNNMFLPQVMGPALVAVYTAIGAGHVLDGKLRLGVYLATINVFADISGALGELFGLMMDVVGTFPALKELTLLLNMATDLPDWKVCQQNRTSMTFTKLEALDKLEDDAGTYIPRVDRLDIELLDLSFAHKGEEPLFKNLCFSCKQGQICIVRGKSGYGRRTLLELISSRIFPSSGVLFIPSHCRVLYVSQEIVLLNLSVWHNLTFGNLKGNNPHRVESILKHFGMNRVLEWCHKDLEKRKKEINKDETELERGEDEHDVHFDYVNPMDKLRESEKADVHLVRAFIMNPEVMVLHRPFVHYHPDDHLTATLHAFAQHRDNRGFLMPAAEVLMRRPRTVFISTDRTHLHHIADIVWEIPKVVGGEGTMYKPSESEIPQDVGGESVMKPKEEASKSCTDLDTLVPYGYRLSTNAN